MSKQINPVTRVCVHEAGHAVMMHIRGMRVAEVRIFHENIKTHVGEEGNTLAVKVRVSPQSYAEIAVSGVVAESIVLGVCPVRRLKKLTDNEEMHKAMDALMISVYRRNQVRRKIMKEVKKKLREHMDQLMRIAELVEKNEVVGMDEIEKIMGWRN